MRSDSKTTPSTKNKNVARPRKAKQQMTVVPPLTAGNLRDVLWSTLNELKDDNMMPNRADAIAAQAREILRTVNTQLRIAGAARRNVPTGIIKFSED